MSIETVHIDWFAKNMPRTACDDHLATDNLAAQLYAGKRS